MKRTARYALLILLALSGFAHATGPRVKWDYTAKSNLYGPPLVADMNPAPGLETVVCDAEVRAMICLDARGKRLWRYNGDFKKRLIAPPALSAPGSDGVRLLLLGNADGQWAAVNAANGKEVWKKTLGGVEWGNGLWADLDGDGTQEAVAPTLSDGVAVLDRAGNERWRYKGPEGKPTLEIRASMAAADVDGDGKTELFGAEKYGLFSLSAEGALRWETITWDDFESGVVLGAQNATNPQWRVFSASHDQHAAWAFDANTGAVIWRQPLQGVGNVYTGSSIALADLNASPFQASIYASETSNRLHLVVGDTTGHIQAFAATNGTPCWTARTNGAVHVTATLGDVDGDGWCDVLGASGDHRLYAYNRQGSLVWDFITGLRLVYPPSLADIDDDGRTEILTCGSDSVLRCLTLDGVYDPGMMPWPMRGQNPAMTNALPLALPFAPRVEETVELLQNGGFEEGQVAEGLGVPAKDSEVYQARIQCPKGWMSETAYGDGGPLGPMAQGVPLAGWRRDTAEPREGAHTLLVEKPMTVASAPTTLPRELAPDILRAAEESPLTVEVFSKGPGAKAASLRFDGRDPVIPLERKGEEAGWIRWATDQVAMPYAREFQLLLETGEGGATWDGAKVTAKLHIPAELRVLVNQVGYDTGAPKRFVAQGNVSGEKTTFAVKRGNDVVFEGLLQAAGRIKGAYGPDWGYNYWTGDFSAVGEPGEYIVETRVGDTAARSYPFRVGENILWDETIVPTYKFFYYQRCGMEIPGIHGACHLDDARGPDGQQYELWGGWHDAGDYNTYDNAPYVHGLARAYQRTKTLFDALDQDANGRADFLDEILWGAEHTRRMIAPDGSAYGAITSGYGFWAAPELETDGKPGTGDERPVTGSLTGNNPSHDFAAMAKMALWETDKAAWTEPARRGLQYAIEHGLRGPEAFSAAVDLFEATGDPMWGALAKELFPPIQANATIVEAVSNYDRLFNENHQEAIRTVLKAKANEFITLANNPFGVLTFGTPEQPNFFKTPADRAGWHVGTTMYLFEAAELVALAYQYNPDPRYLTFVYDQFNWTLGMNPFNLSLMEGCGDAFLPSYHNRHTFGGVARGAIPGGIVNGLTWRAVGDDRPFVDLTGNDIPAYEPNEFWLPHNTNYINAITALRHAR